jgi:hypothetical protein
VFSGNQQLHQLAGITQIVGSHDPVAAFGRLAYPGRLPLLPLSNWNKAWAQGQIQRWEIAGLNHNGSRGPFADRFRLPVVKAIVAALPESVPAPVQTDC